MLSEMGFLKALIESFFKRATTATCCTLELYYTVSLTSGLFYRSLWFAPHRLTSRHGPGQSYSQILDLTKSLCRTLPFHVYLGSNLLKVLLAVGARKCIVASKRALQLNQAWACPLLVLFSHLQLCPHPFPIYSRAFCFFNKVPGAFLSASLWCETWPRIDADCSFSILFISRLRLSLCLGRLSSIHRNAARYLMKLLILSGRRCQRSRRSHPLRLHASLQWSTATQHSVIINQRILLIYAYLPR